MNNTDINTRIGWYSRRVTGATEAGATHGYAETDAADASWSGKPLAFARIQGADCCGYVAAVGEGVDRGHRRTSSPGDTQASWCSLRPGAPEASGP